MPPASLMPIVLDKGVTQNPIRALGAEWIECNGLGGWASSTLCGANTRRYHGLLVVAQPPRQRFVLLSKLDEAVTVSGERFDLGCNCFPGALHPTGYRYLESFTRGMFPVFEYSLPSLVVKKTVAAVHRENTVVVIYEALPKEHHEPPTGKVELELRPLVAARDYHCLTHKNDGISLEAEFKQGQFRVKPYPGVPELFISVPGSEFRAGCDWYYNFELLEEQERGLDYREDLFTHGTFHVGLEIGKPYYVVISAESTAKKDGAKLFRREGERRSKLIKESTRCKPNAQASEDVSQLVLAADQFVVSDESGVASIIAGYHWFTEWGRDAMIALPGLCSVTGRHEEAKGVLQKFTRLLSDGMLPNFIPDGSSQPEYNSVDATLWLFVAVQKYLRYSGDKEFVKKEMLEALLDVVVWHERGTRFGIKVDGDGLLTAGAPGVQLTWMDAKVGDWVVTPRRGKAVEVNALWCNALAILGELLRECGEKKRAKEFTARFELARETFSQLFWCEERGYLYDCIEGGQRDSRLRPNQIFALSLPYVVLSDAACACRVLSVVEGCLYTPYGLRSLDPADSDYRPIYVGDQLQRDGAYHQGTVWSWLLGPYITALVRFGGADGRDKARRVFTEFLPHLKQAGIGTVSEILDGREPHRPRGCIAQAWGVGELLRAYVEDLQGS